MNGPTAPPEMQRESTTPVVDAEAVSVLVVDDEESVADLYAEMLTERYDVETAYGGEAALDVLEETYDVVLLDRRMPDRNGDEVLREIRRRNLGCRVAMVTAVEPDVDIIDMEFDDYVVKPVTGDGLLEIVDRLRMLSKYREMQLELSSKRVKRNVLEAEMTQQKRRESTEFRELEARIEELEHALTAIESELDEDYLAMPSLA